MGNTHVDIEFILEEEGEPEFCDIRVTVKRKNDLSPIKLEFIELYTASGVFVTKKQTDDNGKVTFTDMSRGEQFKLAHSITGYKPADMWVTTV